MRNLLLLVILFIVADAALLAQNCSINAGVSTTICKRDTMYLNGSRSGLLSPGAVSQWTQIGGASVIITSPNALTTSVTGFDAGTYRFKISMKCKDGLFAEDTVTIKVLPLTIANAGRDTALCPLGQSRLQGNAPAAGETGLWTIAGSNGAGVVILAPTDPFSAITLRPELNGVTTCRWTITNSNGCSSYDEVVITNSGGVPQVNAGPDQILGNCFSNSTCATLIASNGGTGNGGQKGVWSFVSGPSIPSINPVVSPTTKVCNLIQGTYVFRYTVSGPCVNGFDDVAVIVPPPTQDVTTANANSFSTNTVYCGILNTISLNGNVPLYTGETVQWTQVSGPSVTINNANSPTATVTGINTYDTYCFKYSITNSASRCVSDNNVCYVFSQNGTVDGGPDQILPCNTTSATIPTIVTGTGELNYKIISGPSGVFNYPVNLRNSNTINGLIMPGTYRIEIDYLFGLGCLPATDFVDITVSRPPTGANAGTDQNFACSATTTQLAGNNPALTGIGSGRWSQISGPNTSTLVTPTNYICNVRGTIPGTYMYRWTITGGNRCPDNFDDIKVVIPDTSVTLADAGNDKVICPYSSLLLNGNRVRADETVQWTTIPAGLSFYPGNTVTNPTVSGFSVNTNYKFIYAITNSCGTVSRDTMLVGTSALAGPSDANAGPDQCLPSGTAVINLNATIPASGTGTWTKITGPSGVISNPGQYNTTVTGITNGTYKFVWRVATAGCQNASEDTVLITVAPNTSVANAGADITACASAVTLNANVPSVGTGMWLQVSGDGDALLNNAADPKATLSNLQTGVYVFRWTISNNACSATSDDVKITISTPPSVSNAGQDQNLCGADATHTFLQANIPQTGNGQWVQVSGPSNATITDNMQASTDVHSLINGIYTFRWVITGGPNCPQSTDEVIVNVSLPANAGRDQNLCNATSTTLSGNTGSNGSWSQVAGPAVTITQNGGNPNASVSGLQAGNTYVFRYTLPSSAGCPSTYDEVTVTNGVFALVPDAGTDASLCNASAVALSGSQPGVGENGVWSILSGPAGATFSPSATSPNATLNNMAPGTYILKWTISNAICSSSDQKRIDNYATPSGANAGADQVVCFEKAILRGNTPSKGIGTWSQLSGPSNTTIAAINNPVTNVTGLSAVGTYVYVWSISNGPVCTPSTDTVKLVVSALSPSIADAGADKVLCQQSSLQLNGNMPVIGTGIWTEISAASTAGIDIPDSYNTNVSNLNTGLHRFVWTIANADRSCFSRDTMQVMNNVLPNTANAGMDDTFCLFSDVVLRANAAIMGTTGAWSYVAGPTIPRLLNPEQPECRVTGVVTGTYIFRWTISSTSCPSSSDEVQVTIINSADQAVAGANQTLCRESINLYGNRPTGTNKGYWSQYSGPAQAVFADATDPFTHVSALQAGTYRFIWKIYNARCFTTDTVTYVINAAANVFAGTDRVVCGDYRAIELADAIVNSQDGLGTWTIISGHGTLSNTAPTISPQSVTYTPAVDEQETVVLRLSAQDACRVVTDDVSITLNESIVPVNAFDDHVTTLTNTPVAVFILENDTLLLDDTLELCNQNSIITMPQHGQASAESDGSILYTPDRAFVGIDSFQYRICTKDYLDSAHLAACYRPGSDTAWVFVNVTPIDCVVPNAFSPNGDGVNDAFVIECGKNKSLNVFNNWGMELYKNEDYQNDWYGTYNGTPLPDGTYYYSLKYRSDAGEIISKAGFICLHR